MQVPHTHDEPRAWRWRWSVLAVFAVLYGVCLPSTVQTLDTGELVAAAWRLYVPHPPGYPLFVWLQHAFMKLVPWGSPFHRAALGNSLCMLGALALLLRIARSWLGVVLVAAVATAPVVWRFAVLPDVFALHLLLTMGLVALAMAPPQPGRVWAAALVFGLGAANHHSILFVAPLLGLIAFEEKSRLVAVGALACGALLTLLAYVSMLLFDTAALSSWGELDSITRVLDHFLRNAYGTFRLSGHDTTADPIELLSAFAVACGAFGVAALALVVIGGVLKTRTWRTERAWWLTLACLLVYIAVFFPRMNLGEHPVYLGVRERFFLFPIILTAALAVRVVVVTPRAPWLVSVMAASLALLVAMQVTTSDAFGYRDDTVVEDYAVNLLETAKRADKPTLLLVDSDTQLFSAMYVKATREGYDDIVPIGRGSIFFVQNMEKIKKRWPAFVFDAKEIFASERRDIFRQFILPNLDSFAVYYMLPFTSPRGRTTIYPLGRRVEAGSGLVVAEASDAPIVTHFPVHDAESSAYVETKELYSDYAIYYLARGKAFMEAGNRDAAKSAFLDGLSVVPYCIPCLKNLCVLDDTDQRCGGALRELEETEYHYFE